MVPPSRPALLHPLFLTALTAVALFCPSPCPPVQLVELKNGETYNGTLDSCDSWMNLLLTQVICTSKDGARFWSMPEVYIRGNNLKYIRIPDEARSLTYRHRAAHTQPSPSPSHCSSSSP